MQLTISGKWTYLGVTKYHDENIGMLFQALNTFEFLVSTTYTLAKKELLTFMAEMMSLVTSH